jgi:hypothetical protein
VVPSLGTRVDTPMGFSTGSVFSVSSITPIVYSCSNKNFLDDRQDTCVKTIVYNGRYGIHLRVRLTGFDRDEPAARRAVTRDGHASPPRRAARSPVPPVSPTTQ